MKEPFVDLNLDAALAKARKEGRVVMIDFTVPWCRACKLLDQTTWKDHKVRAWINERTIPLKIDAGRKRSVAGKYDVESYPTVLFANPDGKEIGRLVGYRDAKGFLSEAEALLLKGSDRRNSSGR